MVCNGVKRRGWTKVVDAVEFVAIAFRRFEQVKQQVGFTAATAPSDSVYHAISPTNVLVFDAWDKNVLFLFDWLKHDSSGILGFRNVVYWHYFISNYI